MHSVSARAMRRMFGRVARRYDLLNRLISFGQDQRWRAEAVRRLRLRPGMRLLDLGTGTGDLALEALRQQPEAMVVAADFTPEMIAVGRRRGGAGRLRWVVAEARRLPFRDAAFEAVVSGFLLRNLPDLDRGLEEQLRILRPAGRWAGLDSTRPARSLLRPFIELHLRLVIPLLGALLSGDWAAYRYLGASTRGFLTTEQLVERLRQAGLAEVGFARRAIGAAAILWGVKPGGWG